MDGWFILENEKREKEAKERATENSVNNERINNSQEVMIVAKNTDHAQSIYESNDSQARGTIKQRYSKIQKEGRVNQIDFVDERLKLIEEKRKKQSQ